MLFYHYNETLVLPKISFTQDEPLMRAMVVIAYWATNGRLVSKPHAEIIFKLKRQVPEPHNKADTKIVIHLPQDNCAQKGLTLSMIYHTTELKVAIKEIASTWNLLQLLFSLFYSYK
jgi:hypothetical protein